jgi:hypothetical protein
MKNYLLDDGETFTPRKEPMKRERNRDSDYATPFKRKDDKRKRREAFERKRGG